MSSTFDTIGHAHQLLCERLKDDAQALDVLYWLEEINQQFHDYAHAQGQTGGGQELNRVAGRRLAALGVALRYEDPVERKKWMDYKLLVD